MRKGGSMRARLKEARKQKKLTHKDVADYLGMINTAYQKIEYGTRGTSESNWMKLHELFDGVIPLHELMRNTP